MQLDCDMSIRMVLGKLVYFDIDYDDAIEWAMKANALGAGEILLTSMDCDGTKAGYDIELTRMIADNVSIPVIATGGSVVYGKEAMEHLKSIGTIVYLQLPFEELEKRLNDIKGRGVVLKDGQTLRDLYAERIPLYEKYADVVVNEYGTVHCYFI